MTTLVTIGFIAIFFVLMSVRLLLKKDGEFKGTCASQNPYLVKEGITCSGACGGNGECKKELNEVEKVLKKFK
jgi:Na+-transporting NADH:ubiquinone oxidoreductase subunit NqrF